MAGMRFEFRLEMSRSFVLSELQPFLFASQFRLEMQPKSSKLTAFLRLERLRMQAGETPELRVVEALDDILF
jgi:hypothetical protein